MKKNKVLAASLATTLALGTVAPLPLSFANEFGGKAVASSLTSSEIAKLNAVYEQLSETDKGYLRAARTELQKLDENDVTLLAAVWAKMPVDQSGVVTQAKLIELIKEAGIFYDPTYANLEAVLAKQETQDLLQGLADLAGVTISDFTRSDVIQYASAVKAALVAKLNGKTTAELVNITSSTEKMKALAIATFDEVNTADATKNLDLSKLFVGLNIKGEDVIKDYNVISNKVDPQDRAERALIKALVASEAEFKTTVTNNGRTATVELKLFNRDLTNLVTWTATGNANISFDTTNKNVLLLSSSAAANSPQAATITASVLGIELYRTNITMTYTASSQGGPIGGGTVVDSVKGPNVAQATKKIEENMAKIAELAKNPKAGNGLKQAREAVENLIREAAKIDISGSVKVENGVAKPQIDLNKIKDAFKSVKDIAKLANEKLKEAAPNSKPAKIVATLDLGTVDAATAEIPLSKELLDAAKEYGIDAIAVVINGVSLAIDVDQLTASTTMGIKKLDKSTAGTSLKVASEVYELTFKAEDKLITNFSKPVEVKLPATVAAGVDKDLLTLTKIENGKLTFKGGQYSLENKEFTALNKSFSSYAIVENKVSFKDTASVESWAGRQIAVIASKGIIEGRGANEYVPQGKVTRAEFAKMLVKAYGLEDVNAKESFADVSDKDWYQPYVAAAVQAGLVQGRSAEKFDPNATITRAEMATMVARALAKLQEYQATLTTDEALKAFADAASINSTLKDGVALAAEQGIVIGDNGKFNPNDASTRAQAAVVIHRLLNK